MHIFKSIQCSQCHTHTNKKSVEKTVSLHSIWLWIMLFMTHDKIVCAFCSVHHHSTAASFPFIHSAIYEPLRRTKSLVDGIWQRSWLSKKWRRKIKELTQHSTTNKCGKIIKTINSKIANEWRTKLRERKKENKQCVKHFYKQLTTTCCERACHCDRLALVR